MITKLLRPLAVLLAAVVIVLSVMSIHGPSLRSADLRPVVLSQSDLLFAEHARAAQSFSQAERKITIASKPRPARVPKPAPTPPPGISQVQQIAFDLMPQFGLEQSQFGCLVDLWNRESGWNYRAEEPTTHAYGIPQSLPASKMAAFGSDYLTDPTTQIKWGESYVRTVYGTACNAWDHDYQIGWY